MLKQKTENGLQVFQLEEITELKRLVVEMGEKITKDEEQRDKKKEEEKASGINYWTRDITPCNKNNYFVCVVCETVPKIFHFLKVRTCSPECSEKIESMLVMKPTRHKD